LCTSPLSHTCTLSRSIHSPWFAHPHKIFWEQFIKLRVTSSSPLCCNIVPLVTKYLLITPLFNSLGLRFSLWVIQSVTLFFYQ
jgi:hypothetical protein